MEGLNSIISVINGYLDSSNGYLYNYILLALFAVVAIYFTIRLKGIQFRYIIHAAKQLGGKHKEGGISGFAAYCVSTASRVGTGNMAGVMVAIAAGGVGALFWMWVMALFGGSLAFVESTLAQLYKAKDRHGKFIGGPSYFIRTKLKQPVLATIFAIMIIFVYTAFNGMQANTIANALVNYNIPITLSAIILAIITAIILLNPRREALTMACSIVVPAMAIPYILIGLIIFVINIANVPNMFAQILTYAFTPSAVTGGVIGVTISQGLRRGLFSNEAGMGGAPHAAAAAATTHPVRQGFLQMFSVFTDTLIICSTSAFILLLSPEAMQQVQNFKGIQLLQYAMTSHLGSFGGVFVTVCILLFAYSSILGNFFYIRTGAASIKESPLFEYIVVGMTLIMIIGGSLLAMPIVWNIGDFLMGITALINLVVILVLFKPARVLLKDYEKQLKENKIPTYCVNNTPEIKDEAITSWDVAPKEKE